MKKSNFYRFRNYLRAIAIGALIFILIYASAMLAPKLISDKSTKLKVYRMSNNESNNCTMNLYNDYVTSLKGVSIQPYAADIQLIIQSERSGKIRILLLQEMSSIRLSLKRQVILIMTIQLHTVSILKMEMIFKNTILLLSEIV